MNKETYLTEYPKHESMRENVKKDKNRLHFHMMPPTGWMNDPNGLCEFQGVNHIYFQYTPFLAGWGTKLWGHYTTKDWIHYKEEEPFLYPDEEWDRDGVYSGSAYTCEDGIHYFYTGNVKLWDKDYDYIMNGREQNTIHVFSPDGKNIAYKKLVMTNDDYPVNMSKHVRDPKIYKKDGRYYMIQGGRDAESYGCALLFCSDDLEHWKWYDTVRTAKPFGYMWECPDYFEVDNSQVVIFSPMQLFKDGKAEDAQTVCMQVTFDKETCDMKLPEKYQFLDYGTDLYAPQSTLDESGRRILTAWLRMPEPVDGKWQGMMCIPRVVEAKENHIYFRVHPNIQAAYTKEISEPSEADESGYRLRFSLEDGDKVNVGGYVISREGNKICTDRSALFEKFPNHRVKFETPELKDGFEIEAYVNPNQISVFVNNGEAVITNTVYDLKKEINTDVRVKIETL